MEKTQDQSTTANGVPANYTALRSCTITQLIMDKNED